MRPNEAGASLIETLVAFGLTVAVSSFALVLLGLHHRLARAHLADATLQEAQQAAHRELRQALRAAGRGGVGRQDPGQTPRPELAAAVERDVAPGHPVGSATAAGGTDVLIVRGVINGPLYWVGDYDVDEAAGSGWAEVRAETAAGLTQRLAPLQDAASTGDDALLLVSTTGAVHAVVPITDVAARGRGRRRVLRVHFTNDASRGPIAAGYLGLSSGGGWPVGRMDAVRQVGVLEEWRFYVRPAAQDVDRGPQLAMARFYPGTGIAWRRRNSNLVQPIADDIVDLEAAVDQGPNGRWTARVVTIARSGGAAAAAPQVDRTTVSTVRLRHLP